MEIDDAAVARLLPDYERGGELGRGQFGVVWSARHRHLGRQVAVKHLTGMGDREGAENARRFRREARILAGLDHPHVVTVFDYREEGDLRLIVMEHLDGGTLADRRDELGPTGHVAAMIAAAAGLHHAHESGVLHRDVKPENLMFDRRQVLKVTDFGVARGDATDLGSATETGVELSRVGQFFGTPAYVSPEQAAAAMSGTKAALGPAADLYGLAAVGFELLTGELTHDAEGGLIGLCHRRINEAAPPVRTLAPDVDAPVAQVIDRALARDPSERHESLEAFAVALARAGNASYGPGWLERSAVELRDTGPIRRALDAPPARGWGAERRRDRFADTTQQGGPVAPLPPTTAPPTAAPARPTTPPTAPTTERTAPPPTPRPAGGASASSSSRVVGSLTQSRDQGAEPPASPTPRPATPSRPPGAPTDVVGPVRPAPPPTPSPGPRTSSAPRRARRWVLILLAIAVLAAIVGAALVLLRPDDDENTPAGAGPGVGAEMTLAWSAATGGDVFSTPAVDGDRVVVGSDDGTVTALAAGDGSRVWSRQVTSGEPVRASVAVAGDRYLVAGFDGHVRSLARADGAEQWAQDLGFQIVATPVVGGDTVVIGTDVLHGRALADGDPRWEYRSPAADGCDDALGAVFIGTPVVDGTTVVAVSAEGTVHAVDLASGEAIWTNDEPGCGLVARPHVAEGEVTVGDGDGILWTISLDDGTVVRRVDLSDPIRAAVTFEGDRGAVGTGAGVVGIGTDGRVRWTTDLAEAVDSSPAIVDGLVVVGSNDRRVYALDLDTGEVVSSFRTGGEVLSSPAVLDDETVVVGSSDDAVRALTDLGG